jgi:alpha-ketoglutarate-dependent taurine dioxygenase
MENKLNKPLLESNNEIEVNATFLDNQEGFPLVITAKIPNLNLSNWISNNKELFNQHILKNGAILFRKFQINTFEKFENLMSVFPKETLEYKFRSSPRFEIQNKIYVSTTYPEDEDIKMHSENSYSNNPPEGIVFCCIIPSIIGGETPIADNRLVLKYLSNDLKNKFLEKGVQYRRNLNSMFGLSWEEVFQTSDKKVVESYCYENNMKFEWLDNGGLTIIWNKMPISEHPKTKELVWFSHVSFFNKNMLPEDIISFFESEDQLPNNTYFGDGSEITKEEIQEINSAYEKTKVQFSWEEGDVLFLDNMLSSHGRNSFQGERKIITSFF